MRMKQIAVPPRHRKRKGPPPRGRKRRGGRKYHRSGGCLVVLLMPALMLMLAVGIRDAFALDTDNDGYGNWNDADFNQDGIVNFSDLAEFRLIFGSDNPGGDLTGDGRVNFADLARFRALFGKPPGGVARLSWEAPTENEDGSVLTDLAGYKVYSSNDLTAPWTEIDVTDTTILIDNLRSGAWWFRVKAFDSSENKNLSVPSATGMKEIL